MILSKKIRAILYILLAASVCEGMERTESSPEELNVLGNTHWNAYLANPTDPTANESLKNAIMCWERSADFQPSQERLSDLGKMPDANIQYMMGNVYWDSFERDPALLDKKKDAILRWLLASTYGSAGALEQITLLKEKKDSLDYLLIGSTLWEIYESYPNRERLNSYAIGSVQYLIESTALMLQSKGKIDPVVVLINKILESALDEGNPGVLLGLADVFYKARFGEITMFSHGFKCLHALIKAKNTDVENKMVEIFSKFPNAMVHFNEKMDGMSKAMTTDDYQEICTAFFKAASIIQDRVSAHKHRVAKNPTTIPADECFTTTTITTTTPTTTITTMTAPKQTVPADERFTTTTMTAPKQSVSPQTDSKRRGGTRKGRKNNVSQPSNQSKTQGAARNTSAAPSKAEQKHDASPNELYERGSAYLRQGNFKEAEPLLRAAGEQGNIEAMSALGVAYTMEKNYAEANKCYLRAVSLGSISAMGNYGLSLEAEGNFDEAEKYLKMAIKRGYNPAIKNIALLYKEQNKIQAGKNYLVTLIKEGHTNAAASFFDLFIENLEGKEAEEILRPLIKGGDVFIMNSIGFIYAKEENYIEAKKYFFQALELGSTEAMRNYGEILGCEGNFDEAEKYLKMAIKRGYTPAIENIASLYKEQNKIQAGKNYLATLIKEGHPDALGCLLTHFKENMDAQEIEKYAELFALAIDKEPATPSNLNSVNKTPNQQETHPVEEKSGPEAKAEEREIPSQSREEGDAPSTLEADVSKESTHQKRPGLERSKTIADLTSLRDAGASSSTFEQPDSGKSNREKPKKTLPPRPLRRTVSSNHLSHPEETAMKLPENSVGGKKTLKTRALDFLKPTKYKGSTDNGKDKDKSLDKKTKSKKSDSTSVETRSSESKEASGTTSKKTLTRKKSSRSLKSIEETSLKAEMSAETLVSLKKLPELPNDYSPEHNELLCEILTHKFELDPTNQNTLSIILNRKGRKIEGGDIRKLFKELFKNTEKSEDSNAEMSEGEGSNTEKSEDSSQKDIRQTGGSHKVIKSVGLTLNPKAEGSKRKKGSYSGQLNNAKVKIIERIAPKLTMVDYEAAQKKG